MPGVYVTLPGLALAFLIGSAGIVAAQGLPGGATSLNETHGDWTVGCSCAMSQTQVSGENRQRLLAVELTADEDGNAANGLLVLPFGLKLHAGVRLTIDEGTALDPPRFSTCLPARCVVPLAFDAPTVTALKAGTAIEVRAMANDSSQELAFSISVSGFTSALNRIAELNALSP